MTMRNAIAALIFAVPCALGFSSAASAQQAITIASWGGAYAKSQRETYFEPFSEKYDVQITDVVWDDDVNAIQRQVLSGEYQWDIVDAQQDTVLDGCDLGILDPIDYGLMGGREAFLEGAALQCGICTPGFLVASKALLDQNSNPSEEEIRWWLAGNLCRCTGYDKIIRAVQDAAERINAGS